jgi:hypothetical protein
MRIIGAGSAFPENLFEQQEITAALKKAVAVTHGEA